MYCDAYDRQNSLTADSVPRVSMHLMSDAPTRPCATAYLVSQYPALSMSFILREVVQLRQLGARIDVASINSVDRAPEELTAIEAAESIATYYVKEHGWRGALVAHAAAMLRQPAGWLRGWGLVVRLAGADLRALALNFAYFTEALMIGGWMHRRNQGHLHAHLGSQAATVAMWVKSVFGHGFSITVHGPDEFYDAYRKYLPRKILTADFICCISHFARSQLMRLSPYEHWHKLLVVRLGVDSSQFSPRPRPQPKDGVYEVLCVGRLTPSKGQHLLIDAVAQLIAGGRQLRLRVVGGGDDRAALQQHAQSLGLEEHVLFEGPVNQDHVRTFYAKADCFCMASFAEGIPVVLMEAMAMGIPCVTTHINGIPELIGDGSEGLLVAPSDVAGLVAALARLMDDRVLSAQLASAGRMRVMEDYNLERNVRKLAEVFTARIGSAAVVDTTAPARDATVSS
jgi:colanic acid/amylovoran biosynthesis glycosyltransferase